MLRCGDGHVEPFWGQRLGVGDVDEVFALHRQLIRDLPRDLVAAESYEFFLDHVERKGRLLGLLTRQGLVAYAVLGLPGPGDANFGADHRLPVERMSRVAHLDGAGVNPLYRGNRLHRLLVHWRLDEARAANRPIVLSTTAPGNDYSRDNLLAGGLLIRGLMHKFGGWRYLLRRDLDLDVAATGSGQWADAGDLTAHAALLQAGWCGWAARGGARREILFTRVREKPVKDWRVQYGAEDGGGGAGSQPISRQ